MAGKMICGVSLSCREGYRMNYQVLELAVGRQLHHVALLFTGVSTFDGLWVKGCNHASSVTDLCFVISQSVAL